MKLHDIHGNENLVNITDGMNGIAILRQSQSKILHYTASSPGSCSGYRQFRYNFYSFSNRETVVDQSSNQRRYSCQVDDNVVTVLQTAIIYLWPWISPKTVGGRSPIDPEALANNIMKVWFTMKTINLLFFQSPWLLIIFTYHCILVFQVHDYQQFSRITAYWFCQILLITLYVHQFCGILWNL